VRFSKSGFSSTLAGGRDCASRVAVGFELHCPGYIALWILGSTFDRFAETGRGRPRDRHDGAVVTSQANECAGANRGIRRRRGEKPAAAGVPDCQRASVSPQLEMNLGGGLRLLAPAAAPSAAEGCSAAKIKR